MTTQDISHEGFNRSNNWLEVLPATNTIDPRHSPRYKFIETKEIIECAQDLGFEVVSAMAIKKKDPLKQAYAKHQILLVNRNFSIPGEGYLSLWARNAHDKSSLFHAMLGFYRTICSNALISGAQFDSYRLTHSGKAQFDFESVLQGAIAQAPKMIDTVERMKEKTLNKWQEDLFVSDAIHIFQSPESTSVINPESVTASRRVQDDIENLWTLFNRTQENIIRGGVSYRTKTGKICRTRGLSQLDRTAKVNRALWDLAESYLSN